MAMSFAVSFQQPSHHVFKFGRCLYKSIPFVVFGVKKMLIIMIVIIKQQ